MFLMLNLLLRWANRAARYISCYALGLDGAEAAHANHVFHGHRMLPPVLLAAVKRDFEGWMEGKKSTLKAEIKKYNATLVKK